MMSVPEIRAHLEALEYGDFRYWVHEDVWEGPLVTFLVDVEDTYNPGETVTLRIPSYLSPNDRASTYTLDLWVQWRLVRIASHEAREFLKRDGRPVFDPHGT